MLVASYMRKRAIGGGGDDIAGMREYLAVNAAFYGAIVLTMLFFWGWFWTLNPDSETGGAVNLAPRLLPHHGRPVHLRSHYDRSQSLVQRWRGRVRSGLGLRWPMPAIAVLPDQDVGGSLRLVAGMFS